MAQKKKKQQQYLQNRELSWLAFNERVLDQGMDTSVPLLERLNFVSIFWSNLQEFFMVRVGSLTDLQLIKKSNTDSKTQFTPTEQIAMIHERCHQQVPLFERAYQDIRSEFDSLGFRSLTPDEMSKEQLAYLDSYGKEAIAPLLAPQIISRNQPFPHLENGALYVVCSLYGETYDANASKNKDKNSNEPFALGLIPMPRNVQRLIPLPGEEKSFVFLEHAIEYLLPDLLSMYTVTGVTTIVVTRNSDLDALQGYDEDLDYREHMKRILKKRARLAPVRLESQSKLEPNLKEFLLGQLGLTEEQYYINAAPLDFSFISELKRHLSPELIDRLSYPHFDPVWPMALNSSKSLIEQIRRSEYLLLYPFDSMNPLLMLLREAAVDPKVESIHISLYRVASQSRLIEALILAAEQGKKVVAFFELRARFDESNNIEWSQRCEQAGIKVLYGFRDMKVHSKICLITRKDAKGVEYITQLGTGNYNEKTASLYTDYSFFTSDFGFGQDAKMLFDALENDEVRDDYQNLVIAPLQLKQLILKKIQEQIEQAQQGFPAKLFFKMNSLSDLTIINKLSEASKAGVSATLIIRGICCMLPGIEGKTENIEVYSLVGRLLEHSRLYVFGPKDNCEVYLSSADLMTRNMDRRIEAAWPVHNPQLKSRILKDMDLLMSDTIKLRKLNSDGTYALPMFQQHAGVLQRDYQQTCIDASTLRPVPSVRKNVDIPLQANATQEEKPKGFLAKLKAFFSRN